MNVSCRSNVKDRPWWGPSTTVSVTFMRLWLRCVFRSKALPMTGTAGPRGVRPVSRSERAAEDLELPAAFPPGRRVVDVDRVKVVQFQTGQDLHPELDP